MDKTICGHERDVLIWALSWARDVWANDDTSLRELATMSWSAKNPTRYAVVNAIIDPAKLAEMLAHEGRRLGLGFWHGPNEPREPLPTDYVLYVIGGVIRLYSPLSPKAWQRQYTMVQARAILLAWLQLPDVPRDASKGDEFGQCDECGDGIDPPSDTDDLALSAWESDHPGEQVSLCEFDTRWLCVPCLRNAVHDEADLVLRGES